MGRDAIVGGFGLMELIYSLNLFVGFSWAAFDTVCLFVLGVRKFLIIYEYVYDLSINFSL